MVQAHAVELATTIVGVFFAAREANAAHRNHSQLKNAFVVPQNENFVCVLRNCCDM